MQLSRAVRDDVGHTQCHCRGLPARFLTARYDRPDTTVRVVRSQWSRVDTRSHDTRSAGSGRTRRDETRIIISNLTFSLVSPTLCQHAFKRKRRQRNSELHGARRRGDPARGRAGRRPSSGQDETGSINATSSRNKRRLQVYLGALGNFAWCWSHEVLAVSQPSHRLALGGAAPRRLAKSQPRLGSRHRTLELGRV